MEEGNVSVEEESTPVSNPEELPAVEKTLDILPGATIEVQASVPVTEEEAPAPDEYSLDFNLLKAEVLSLGKRLFGEAVELEHKAGAFFLKVGEEVKHVLRLF